MASMLLARMLRFWGTIAVLLLLLGAMTSLAGRNFVPFAICVSLAFGLIVAIVFGSSSLMHRHEMEKIAARRRVGGVEEGALSIGVRWFKGFCLICLFSLIGAALWVAAIRTWADGDHAGAFFIGLVALASIALATASFRQIAAALLAGYVMRVDPLGFAHSQTGFMPWRHVLAIDLLETEHKGITRWSLQLTLAREAFEAARYPAWIRIFDWSRPVFAAAGKVMSVDLGLAACNPAELLATARANAERARKLDGNDLAAHYEEMRPASTEANRWLPLALWASVILAMTGAGLQILGT